MSVENSMPKLPENHSHSPFLIYSETIKKLMKRTTLIAGQRGPVLIEGESGSGKTRLAEELHKLSNRANGPFLEIGCGELSYGGGSFESALFGHTRDAYTGADSFQQGIIAQANGGVLVLNDIDRLPPECQGRFLRFLDDGHFTRVGEPGTSIDVDVRVVATTNKELADLVKQDLFLHDLFFRLKQWRIKVPPLRRRPEDIRRLAHYYLEGFRRENQETSKTGGKWTFSDQVYGLFLTMQWPDNIRGLRSAVENIALFCEGDRKEISLKQAADVLFDPEYNDYVTSLGKNDKSYLLSVLKLTNWNIKLASLITGFSRTTIYKWAKEEGWDKG